MAIDPPYRLDPFRNIINVHWNVEGETTTGGGTGRDQLLIHVMLMGSHWSSGYYNNNNYDIYFAYIPPAFFTIVGMSEYTNIANYSLTNPQNFATAWAASAATGLNFAATWESHANGTNEILESWGPYGIDLGGVTATTQDTDPADRITYRAVALSDIAPGYVGGDSTYSGWLDGYLVLEADI